MKSLFILFLISTTIILTSCGGWNDDRKKTILDKCDAELYDCNCFLQKTMETFPEPDQYNETLENEAANQQKVDAYWKSLEGCMK
jgi:hypothetical protein